MEFNGIIFDLDGVIINTENLHLEAYQEAFKNNGKTLSVEEYDTFLRSKGKKYGLPKIMGSDHVLIEKIGSDKDRIFKESIEKKSVEIYEDAIGLIKYCSEKNKPMAIGTASVQGKQVLEKLNLCHYFDVIVTGKDVKKNKPNPEMYIKCGGQLKFDKESLIVIEDSESGIVAGIEAGYRVVFIDRDNQQVINQEILEHENVFTYKTLDLLINN